MKSSVAAATVRAIPDRPDEVDEGWFKFPNHLAHRLWKFKAGDIHVYLALRRFSQKDGYAFPSIGKLREMTGMSERSIQYALANLEKLGLIVRHFKRGRSTNYRVNDMFPHK